MTRSKCKLLGLLFACLSLGASFSCAVATPLFFSFRADFSCTVASPLFFVIPRQLQRLLKKAGSRCAGRAALQRRVKVLYFLSFRASFSSRGIVLFDFFRSLFNRAVKGRFILGVLETVSRPESNLMSGIWARISSGLAAQRRLRSGPGTRVPGLVGKQRSRVAATPVTTHTSASAPLFLNLPRSDVDRYQQRLSPSGVTLACDRHHGPSQGGLV